MYIIKSIFGTFNCLLIAVIRLLIRLFLPTLSVIYFRIKLFFLFFFLGLVEQLFLWSNGCLLLLLLYVSLNTF